MQVAPRQVEPAIHGGEAEADDHAADVAFLEHALTGEDAGQRRVGLTLGTDGAQPHTLEAPLDPHGGAGGRKRRELGKQRVDILGDADVELDAGLEGGDQRERTATLGLGRVHRPVMGGAVEHAVGEHELAIERVERAKPEVAASCELGDGQIAVIGAMQKRLDRRLEARGSLPAEALSGARPARAARGVDEDRASLNKPTGKGRPFVVIGGTSPMDRSPRGAVRTGPDGAHERFRHRQIPDARGREIRRERDRIA